jgi:hypothetical protein
MKHYYLVPEVDMKNIYLEESFYELNNKKATPDELALFEQNIRKVDTIETQLINGENVDVYVNYYVLKYKSKFSSVNSNFERHTIEEVRAIIDEIEQSI